LAWVTPSQTDGVTQSVKNPRSKSSRASTAPSPGFVGYKRISDVVELGVIKRNELRTPIWRTTGMSNMLVNRDVESMAPLLRETQLRHRGYEASAPQHDWAAWYAAYIVARECGKTSEDATSDATRHVEASGEQAQKEDRYASRHGPRRGVSRLRAA
jgi:hypothetical protein